MPNPKLRLRYHHWLPKLLRVSAIVLYPYVLFASPKGMVSPLILQHEMIHVRQVRELGWLKFYGLYLWEYFRNRWRGYGKNEAYLLITFEKEAYEKAGSTVLSEAEKNELGLANPTIKKV